MTAQVISIKCHPRFIGENDAIKRVARLVGRDLPKASKLIQELFVLLEEAALDLPVDKIHQLKRNMINKTAEVVG